MASDVLEPQRTLGSVYPVQGTPTIQTDPLDFSVLDTDLTSRYKIAFFTETPTRLLLIRLRKPGEKPDQYSSEKYHFIPLLARVSELANQGIAPLELYNDITSNQQRIKDTDIGMSYLTYLQYKIPQLTEDQIFNLTNEFYHAAIDPDLPQQYTDYQSMLANQSAWFQQINGELEADRNRLNTILEVQTEFLALKQVEESDSLDFKAAHSGTGGIPELVAGSPHPILIGPVTISTVTLAYRPTLVSTGRPVVKDDGPDIFQHIKPSHYVPYIQFNNEHGVGIYRVYEGDSPINTPNFNQITTMGNDINKPSTIYMFLWTGDVQNDGTDSVSTATRYSFIRVIYHLVGNYIEIKSDANEQYSKDSVNAANIRQRLQAALPYVKLNSGDEIKVTGSFNVWDFQYDDYVLADLILNFNTISVYFYIEENTKPWSQKQRMDLHYRSIFTDMKQGTTVTSDPYISNYASLSLFLRPMVTVRPETITWLDPKGETNSLVVPVGTRYLKVNVYQAESQEVVTKFLPIFRLMLRYYLMQGPVIKSLYLSILPDNLRLPELEQRLASKPEVGEGSILDMAKHTKSQRTGNEQIQHLKELAPDLFIEGGARAAQGEGQPIILQPEEVFQWQSMQPPVTIIMGGVPTIIPRQIMPFPPGPHPRWLFACPSDLEPYPGVKINRMPNRDKYPVFPRCYKKDHISRDASSKYNKFLAGELQFNIGAKADKIISTGKILARGKVGTVPKAVKRILSNYSEDHHTIVRMGTVYSPNSIFHAISTVLLRDQYDSLSSEEAEQRMISLRLQMASKTQPALLKQEMWDYEDSEIAAWLRDPTVFYDPAMGYRALEEFFNVNIYVFILSKDHDDSKLGQLEVPRHHDFHARPQRTNRSTIIIYKTWGSESNGLKYPQCELIMDYDSEDQQAIQVFDELMTILCHEILTASSKTISWSVSANNQVRNSVNEYYYVNYLEMLGNPSIGRIAISQHLDPYGKVRAMSFTSPQGVFTAVTTVPGQPENLPENSSIIPINTQVLSMFMGEANPPTAAWYQGGIAVGLWYPLLDQPQGLYFPIIPVASTLPPGNPNPLARGDRQITGLYRKLTHIHHLIKQIIRWLYEVYKQSDYRSTLDFVNRYLAFDNATAADSSTYYDFSRLERRLPLSSNVEEAITRLSTVIPSLLSDGKIVAYSPGYAQKLTGMIDEYDQLRDGLPAKIPEYLQGFYENIQDFQIPRFTKLFLNRTQLLAWLESKNIQQRSQKYQTVRTEIKFTYSVERNPYVFLDDQGIYYLVQNVERGSRIFALQLADYWYYHKINRGYNFHRDRIETISEESILARSHIIYAIGSNNKIVAAKDNSGDSQQFFKVLYYGGPQALLNDTKGSYAALLPLNA